MTVWHYEVGSVRWRRHDSSKGDVRSHRAPKGWEALAFLLEHHPITGRPLKNPGWWICETYTETYGEEECP